MVYESRDPGTGRAGDIRILIEAPPEYLITGAFWGYAGRAELYIADGVPILLWITVVMPAPGAVLGTIRVGWPDQVYFDGTGKLLGKPRQALDEAVRQEFRRHVQTADPWGGARTHAWELAHPGWATQNGTEQHQQKPGVWSWDDRAQPYKEPKKPGEGSQSYKKYDQNEYGNKQGDADDNNFRTHWQRHNAKAAEDARRARETAERLRRDREAQQKRAAEEEAARQKQREEQAKRDREKQGAGGGRRYARDDGRTFSGADQAYEDIFGDFFQGFFGRGRRPPPPPPSPSKRSPWDVLGVPRGSSKEVTKAAYLKLAEAVHPDRGGSHDRMVEVNNAWDSIRGLMEW